MEKVRKILFLTGTRADFGKLKPLMREVASCSSFEMHIFVTGMHMLAKYGYTCEEVERAGFENIYKYVNQNFNDGMDQILSKTVTGLSDYVREVKPEMIVVHGDRVEALAGAIVGAFNNILTAHVEGGEVSGAIDESIRHATSKLAHLHFVANESAKQRLIQLGELQDSIYVIGSPDIDVMNSEDLPSLAEVKKRYDLKFQDYAICIFHPVTTDLQNLRQQTKIILDALKKTNINYVFIYPNNDNGSQIILDEYEAIEDFSRIKIYPSMRFEYFLTLLKNSEFIVGNSSAGVREAPHYGVPALNLGNRQHNRVSSDLVINAEIEEDAIIKAVAEIKKIPKISESFFGQGNSAKEFLAILTFKKIWNTPLQKYFIDQ
jgi:UDP-N-acetylglucosamine 2-epimerase (hydrolysing)